MQALDQLPEKPLQRLRFSLFVATGLALPLHAFPVAVVFRRPIDLSTLVAGFFVVTSMPAVFRRRVSRQSWAFLAGAVIVPLLALTPPRPATFSAVAFASSYGHWLLVVSFFVCALTLQASHQQSERLLFANAILGAVVALFALYQVVGTPLKWAATGGRLVSFQREPFRFEEIDGFVRPTSVFLEPAWMAGYLEWVVFLAITLAALSGRRAFRIAGTLCVCLSLAAILSTVSWGAYAGLVAAAAAGALAAFGSDRAVLRKGLRPLAVVMLVIVLAGTSPPGRRVAGATLARARALLATPIRPDKARATTYDSSWVRYRNLVHTASVFSSRPFRGVGLGQYRLYAGFGEDADLDFGDPWCGWIALAAETGILGPVLLVAAIGIPYHRWTRSKSRYGMIAVPAICALAFVQQIHTGSFIDLWWWFPLAVAAVLGGAPVNSAAKFGRVL